MNFSTRLQRILSHWASKSNERQRDYVHKIRQQAVFFVKTKNKLPKQLGNKMECALLRLIVKLGHDYKKLHEAMPEER